MEERSAFDILIENLVDLGYQPETNASNKIFILPGKDRVLNAKFVLCELSENLYFFASDSFGTKAYTSSTFTGIYSSIDLPEDAEYKVIKREWLHFIYRNRKKTGAGYIDLNLTILSKNYNPEKELSRENVELFLKIHSEDTRYSLIVENDYCPKLAELKGKKVIALEADKWIYKKEELKELIETGGKLISNITAACNK